MKLPYSPALGRLLLIVFAITLGPAASRLHAEQMTLTDKQGRSLKADVLEVSGGQVKLKRDDGQVFNLPLSTLADEDQKTLNAWAAKEAAKSLPPGALQVELSRGIFKTEKRDRDVNLVGGGLVKDGMTITEEKWGYNVTLTNKTSRPLDNLRAEYRLFATVDNIHKKDDEEGLKKKAYQSPVETIPALGRITFRTETVSAFKTKYNGNIVSAKTGDNNSRETLHGIWIRLYRGNELVYESAMPEKLRSTEKW